MAYPVLSGAEAFAFPGGDVGVLLLHGFTGSPQGLRPWGEALRDDGRTILCPLLPGHGTHVETWLAPARPTGSPPARQPWLTSPAAAAPW
jgi:carboxylesterase